MYKVTCSPTFDKPRLRPIVTTSVNVDKILEMEAQIELLQRDRKVHAFLILSHQPNLLFPLLHRTTYPKRYPTPTPTLPFAPFPGITNPPLYPPHLRRIIIMWAMSTHYIMYHNVVCDSWINDFFIIAWLIRLMSIGCTSNLLLFLIFKMATQHI